MSTDDSTPVTANAAASPKRARKKVKPGASSDSPSPKPAEVKASGDPAPQSKGLRAPQIRVLEALEDGSNLTRKEISQKAKVDNASLTGYIGSADIDIREKNDREYYPCLLTLKMIRETVTDENGKNVIRYSIMARGKQFLERLRK